MKPVKTDGQMRIEAERQAVQRLKARAQLPEGCSSRITSAPARGPAQVYREPQVYMTENGPRRRSVRPGVGDAIRVASALDLIELRRRRRRGADPLFTNAHHIAAAEYEALVQRVASGRAKCSSLDGQSGGSDGRSVMDAIIHDIDRLRRMDAAIVRKFYDPRRPDDPDQEAWGNVPVLDPSGARAMPGRRRIWITDVVRYALVSRDPLTTLLERRGWARQTRYLETLQKGLIAALDAIHGL